MAVESMIVGVVVEKRAVSSPWADHVWAPAQVLPDAPDIAPMTLLGGEPDRERYYLGAAEILLYTVDTGHFGDNFVTEAPKLWVSIRPTGIDPPLELVGVTADPHEGAGFVDPLPMPPEIAARVAQFYKAHHVEREFIKRQRDKHDPRKGGQRPVRGLDREPHDGSGGGS
jgi:hypothetical protein